MKSNTRVASSEHADGEHQGSFDAQRTNDETSGKQENIYFLVERKRSTSVETPQTNSPSTKLEERTDFNLVKLGSQKEDKNISFYMVKRKRRDEPHPEQLHSAKPIENIDFFLVKLGSQKEDENNGSFYMVQWDCYDQEKPGYLPFRYDPDFYLVKKEPKKETKRTESEGKENKNKGKRDDKIAHHGSEEKDDQNKVFYMKEMISSETEVEEILKFLKDPTSHQKVQKGQEKETTKQESEENEDKSKALEQRRRKPKVEDLLIGYMFKVKKEPKKDTKNQESEEKEKEDKNKTKREEITEKQPESVFKNLLTMTQRDICVYQMDEMKRTDSTRTEILSCIHNSRWSLLDLMKKVIKKIRTSPIIQVPYKECAVLNMKKVNCIEYLFTIFIFLMLVAASSLIFFSFNKNNSESCEVDEALQFLKVNLTITCKYQEFKNSLQDIGITSIASCTFDGLLLLLSLCVKFITPDRKTSTFITIRVIAIVLSGCFVIPVLVFHIGMTDRNAQQTDNSFTSIKTFMVASLKQDFTSDSITNSDSMSDRWNRFFIKYECCAVNQITTTTNDFDTTPWCTTSGSCQQTNSQIPKTCCKDVTEDDYNNALDSCHSTVTSGSYNDGCFARVKKLNDEALTEIEVNILTALLISMEVVKLFSMLFGWASIFWICCYKCRRQAKDDHSKN